MGRTIVIEFDDNDDEDENKKKQEEAQDDLDENNYNENDQGDTSFDPSSFGTEPDASSSATDPDSIEVDPQDFDEAGPEVPVVKPGEKVDPDALVKAEIRKQEALNRKRLREEQANERRRLKQQMDDEARALRRARREAKAANQEQVTAIRSEAITQRVQAYSVSSVLGLPGYVGAAAVDQFLIRPNETKSIQERKQYEADLERYNQEMEDYRIAQRRAEEDRIKNLPVEAVDVDAIRAKHGLPPTQPATPTPSPTQPSTTPPTPPTPPSGGGGSGGSGGGGGSPPPGPPGNQGATPPPPLPPVPPAPFVPNAIGSALQMGVIGIELARALKGGIESAGKQAETVTRSTFGEDPLQGLREGGHTLQKVMDPLGINSTIQVAVSGFDTLLTMTDEIRQYAKKDLAFSPMALGASVEGDVQKLLQQMDIAQRLDPLKSEIVKQTAQMDILWNELRAELFENLGPAILAAMKLINGVLERFMIGTKEPLTFLTENIGAWPGSLVIVQYLLGMIADNTSKKPDDDLVDRDIQQQIADFLNPNNLNNIPKAAFPNGVP